MKKTSNQNNGLINYRTMRIQYYVRVVSLFLSMTVLFINITSCKYQSEEMFAQSPSPNDCNTANVSYNTFLRPLLQQQCYTCHAGSNPSGGIQMGSYTSDKALAENGKLFGVINHSPGFSPMPQGGAKWSDCQIKQLQQWIVAGSPNN